jgi:hypothetical protein
MFQRNQNIFNEANSRNSLPQLPNHLPFVASFIRLFRGAAFDEQRRQKCIAHFELNSSHVEIEVKKLTAQMTTLTANLKETVAKYNNSTGPMQRHYHSQLETGGKDRQSLEKKIDRFSKAYEFNRAFVRLFNELQPIASVSTPKISRVVGFASFLSSLVNTQDEEMDFALDQISDLGLNGSSEARTGMSSMVQDLLKELSDPKDLKTMNQERINRLEAKLKESAG